MIRFLFLLFPIILVSCSLNNPFLKSTYFNGNGAALPLPIGIDGINHFGDGKKISNSGDLSGNPTIDIYFDYDKDFIYFAINGECIDRINKILYFVCNTSETINYGTNVLAPKDYFEGNQITFPFKINRLYMIKGYSNPSVLKLKRIWDQSQIKWISSPSESEPNTSKGEVYQATNSVTKFTEVAIRRSFLGNPKNKLFFSIYFKDLQIGNPWGPGAIYAVIGHDSTINGEGSKILTSYFEIDLSSLNNSPSQKP